MEMRDFMARAELLNLPELRRKRSDWTDRLPRLPERVSPAAMKLVRKHWSHSIPENLRELYALWLARRRHRLNVAQIDEDEIDDFGYIDEDDPEFTYTAIHAKHDARRVAARFMVASRERYRLQRLARRWDIDAPPMIIRGEANEMAIRQVRRAIREARWIFVERCAKTLIPVLSLLVALAALLSR